MEPVDILEVEDYRVVTVATATGWYSALILDDGVEVIEDVEVG